MGEGTFLCKSGWDLSAVLPIAINKITNSLLIPIYNQITSHEYWPHIVNLDSNWRRALEAYQVITRLVVKFLLCLIRTAYKS